VEVELQRTDWSAVREAAGSAEAIPDAIRSLLTAPGPEDVGAPYWELENHVVLQGQLFEAAAVLVPVLLAALADERPRHVRIALLDLLFQIVSGEPHVEEIERGNIDLTEMCRARAREGLWVLYREFLVGERDAARDVIELVETDSARVMAFLDARPS
jgi:hypothetical protein